MTKPSAKITVPEVMDQFVEYLRKPGNGVGGSLHIVLEDGNVQNHNVQHCLEYAQQHNDEDGAKLAEILLQMSKTQRLKISYEVWPLVNAPTR